MLSTHARTTLLGQEIKKGIALRKGEFFPVNKVDQHTKAYPAEQNT